MPERAEPRWLDAEGAARYVSMLPDAFLRRVKSGRFPTPARRGRKDMWNTQDIDAAFRNEATKGPPLNRAALPALAGLLTADEIGGRAIPWLKTGIGIYFLLLGGEIVYIGQTIDVVARIAQHAKDKIFDHWHWIPCESGALDATEQAYIKKFKPRLNRTWVAGRISENA